MSTVDQYHSHIKSQHARQRVMDAAAEAVIDIHTGTTAESRRAANERLDRIMLMLDNIPEEN